MHHKHTKGLTKAHKYESKHKTQKYESKHKCPLIKKPIFPRRREKALWRVSHFDEVSCEAYKVLILLRQSH